MVSDKPPRRPQLSSLPPETGDIDASWDDEPFGLELEGEFDRPTVVPDEPIEEFAARKMAEARDPFEISDKFPTESQDFAPDSLPPLPSSPPARVSPGAEAAPARSSSAPTPAPSHRRRGAHQLDAADTASLGNPRNTRTNPEPLRPQAGGGRVDVGFSEASGVDIGSLPPLDDFHPGAATGGPRHGEPGGPSIPRSRVQPSGLELELALDSDAPPSGSALDLVSQPRGQAAPAQAQTGPRELIAPTFGSAEAAGASDAASSQSPVTDMKDRYAVGDFTGALVIAESILETEPGHADASRYAESCREVLTQMYAARLGQLDQVVSVAVPPDQIRWLSLDHRAGFLLSLVDGMTSVEEILDVSGMTRLDALRIMFTLLQQRVIGLEAGR